MTVSARPARSASSPAPAGASAEPLPKPLLLKGCRCCCWPAPARRSVSSPRTSPAGTTSRRCPPRSTSPMPRRGRRGSSRTPSSSSGRSTCWSTTPAGSRPTERPFWEADPEEMWGVLETNLRGPLLLNRALVPSMVQRGHGRVVNLSSRARAATATGTYTGYAVSKRALTALDRDPRQLARRHRCRRPRRAAWPGPHPDDRRHAGVGRPRRRRVGRRPRHRRHDRPGRPGRYDDRSASCSMLRPLSPRTQQQSS